MGEMSKPVPLCAALGVHMIDIIICNPFVQSFDLVLERLAAECGYVGYIERQTVRSDQR